MLDTYTVAFVGHRYIDNITAVEKILEKILYDILQNKKYVELLIGRNGDFDIMATTIIKRAQKRNFDYNSSLIWVMPYQTSYYLKNSKYLENYYDQIEICNKSSSVYFKQAFQKRNQYIIDRANLLICYVERKDGGAYQAMQYALKTHKEVINLYNYI